MLTQSFSVDVPKIMFKGMYRDFCEAHDYKIPDQNHPANHKNCRIFYYSHLPLAEELPIPPRLEAYLFPNQYQNIPQNQTRLHAPQSKAV